MGMRDSRVQQVQGATTHAQVGQSDLDVRNQSMSSLVQTAGSIAVSEVRKASELTEEDKQNVAAVQAAEMTYKENEVAELSSGLDRILGKTSKRTQYAKQLAAKNAANRFANEATARLEDYADLDAAGFVTKVSAEFDEWSKTNGLEGESLSNANKEFQRALPNLSGKQAQYFSNANQAKAFNLGVENLSLELDSLSLTISGVAPEFQKEDAKAQIVSMFMDNDELPIESGAPTEVGRKVQLAQALIRQLSSGNTGAYMLAKQAGFMDKLDSQTANALQSAATAEQRNRIRSMNLGVDRRINNATEWADLNELATGMQEINAWIDSGFDTDDEHLAFESARKDLLMAQARLQPKLSREEVLAENRDRLIGMRDNKAAIASNQFSKEVREAAADETMRLRAIERVRELGGGSEDIALEDALSITIGDKELLSTHLDDAIQYGYPSPGAVEYVNGLMEALPAQLASEEGITAIQGKQLKNLVDTATARPADFARVFGEDNTAMMSLVKAHNGNPEMLATALRNYKENVKVPTDLADFGVDTTLPKGEWIMRQIGRNEYTAGTLGYVTDLFDKGMRARGTAQGALEFVKHFQNEIDDDYKGVNIRDGRIFSAQWLQGESVSNILQELEKPMGKSGNSLLTEVLLDRLPEGSTVSKLSDLSDVSVHTDSTTGDIIVASGSMFAPIRLNADDVQVLMSAVKANEEAVAEAEAYKRSQQRFSNMTYQGRHTAVEPMSYNTMRENTADKSGWDEFNKAAGRDSKRLLRELGIIPDEVVDPLRKIGTGAGRDFAPNAVPGYTDAKESIQSVYSKEPISTPTKQSSVSAPARGSVPSVEERERQARIWVNRAGITPKELHELNNISTEAMDILRYEGYNDTVYMDDNGRPTWGVGFRLSDAQISTGVWEEGETRPTRTSAMKQFKAELAVAKRAADSFLSSAGVQDVTQEMVDIFTNMTYNHGGAGIHNYAKVSRALRAGNATEAIEALKDSKWYTAYTGARVDRANELVERLEAELRRQGDWIWEN